MIKFDWKHLSSSEFEEMCKDILLGLGLENVKRMSGPGSGDMGRDVIAEDTIGLKLGAKITTKVLAQCKNYGASQTSIGPAEVERYALRAETLGYDVALIITSYELTSQAKSIAEKISQDRRRRIKVHFWTETDIVDKLEQFPRIREKYFGIPLRVEGTSLEIDGIVDASNHVFVNAGVVFGGQARGEIGFITFLVDTGTTRTTILGRDASRLGINIDLLKKEEPAVTVSGIAETYILPDVAIIFMTKSRKPHVETLASVDVIKVPDDKVDLFFSLLGADVLSKFKISFGKGVLSQ